MDIDIATIFTLIILFITYWILHLSKMRNSNFSTTMVTAVVLGLMLGLLFQTFSSAAKNPLEINWLKNAIFFYGLIGKIYINGLKILTIPIIFIFIIIQINSENKKTISKIAIRTILYLSSLTILAGLVGIFISSILKLGINTTSKIGLAVKDVAINYHSVNNVFLYLVVLALVVGIFIKIIIRKNTMSKTTLQNKMELCQTKINQITLYIVRLMPFATIPLIASTIASEGIKAIISFVDFIVAFYVAIFILFIIQLFLLTLHKLSFRKYLQHSIPPLLLGSISCSSIATLPVTIDNLRFSNGVSRCSANFVATYGASAGLSGCTGLYPALMAITLANMLGYPMDLNFYIKLLIFILISSISLAGIPGAAIISASFVISALGMNEHFILLGGIIAIDPILDMGRTVLNINGAMVSAICIDKKASLLNTKIYNSERQNARF